MKDYKVEIYTNVYIDSYKDGELDHVNHYSNETEIKASRPIEAIEKALYKLGFSFEENYAQIDEEQNILFYSNLVDNDNFEINKKDSYYNEWKEGKRILYSANHSIKVYELSNTNIY